MTEPGCYRRLTPKSLDGCRISGKSRDQNLDCNRLPSAHVLRLVDVRHSTFAELPVDLIALVENLAGKAREGSSDGIRRMTGILLAAVCLSGGPAWRFRASLDQKGSVFYTE